MTLKPEEGEPSPCLSPSVFLEPPLNLRARTLPPDPSIPPRLYCALGFPPIGDRPTRADLVERRRR